MEIHKCLERFWQPCHIFVFIRTISDLLLGCMIWLLKPSQFLESIVYICNDWILEIPMAKVAFVRLSGIVWPVVAILSKQGCKCRTVQICMFWILAVDIKSLFLVYWVYSWAYEMCYWASLTGVLNLHCHIGFHHVTATDQIVALCNITFVYLINSARTSEMLTFSI